MNINLINNLILFLLNKMIKAVKDDVLEKLKRKNISIDKITTAPLKPAQDALKPELSEEPFIKAKNHLQILELIESFEETSPIALNIFIENARKHGIINKENPEIRKKTKSQIS